MIHYKKTTTIYSAYHSPADIEFFYTREPKEKDLKKSLSDVHIYYDYYEGDWYIRRIIVKKI